VYCSQNAAYFGPFIYFFILWYEVW